MGVFCECGGGLLNTGTPAKQNSVRNAAKLILVPLQKADGTDNYIAESDVISGNVDQAYFDALIEAADIDNRWFPVGPFVNVTDVRADSVFETYSDGSRAKVQQGLRTFNGWLINYSPSYKAKLESFLCSDFGVYWIDVCGNLVGALNQAGDRLYPIRVFSPSGDYKIVTASDTEAGKLTVAFDYSQLESDSKLFVLTKELMGDADLSRVKGLIDCKATFSSITTTGATAAISLNFDGFGNNAPVTGLLLADFVLRNETDNAAVTILTATEAPAGTYALTFAAQTSADTMSLSFVKNGKALDAKTFLIP